MLSKQKEETRKTGTVTMLYLSLSLLSVTAFSQTNEFRGVNWSDTRDNFQKGVLYLSGISATDTYASASVVAEKVIGQFVTKLGTNSIRLPINEATASSFWSTYTGVIDVALKKGRVIICFWSEALGKKPADMDAYWAMWQKAVDKYGSNTNCYFEIYNEPNGYSKSDLLNLYETWLKKFPSIPHNRVILDGTGMAQNIPDVGNDPRFKNCLLAVHDYSFWAFYTSEQQWKDHLKGEVGSFANRTVMTEFGAPMKPGTRDGINYGVQDYSSPPGTYFVAYLRGITAQLREWKMGSFYWIGLRDNDWYALTTKTGTGSNIELTINNASGLARVQYAWTDTVPSVVVVPQAPYMGSKAQIPGKIEAENYDVGGPGVSYSDSDPENRGGVYRTDAVDLEGDSAKGFALGYTVAGEWTEYTVNVVNASAYDWSASVASGIDGSAFHFLLDSTQNITGRVNVPNEGSWSTYSTLSGTTPELPAGDHTLRVVIDGDYVNIDWFSFAEKSVNTSNLTRRSEQINWAGASVFDIQGKRVGVLNQEDQTPLREQVFNVVRKNGVYVVKQLNGNASYRVEYK